MQKIKNIFIRFRIFLLKFLIDVNERLIFESKLKKFYKQNTYCNVIIDVGANRGQTIDFFLRLNKKCIIYAFEPNRKLYDLLLKKYNGKPNVNIFMLGVSDKVGKKTFYENIFDYTSTFEEVNQNSAFLEKKRRVLGLKSTELVKDTYDVDVITLGDFILNHGLKKIDVLKIDTEGHEYSCLKGLFNVQKKFNIDFIQTEKLNGDMYSSNFGDVVDVLELNGFQVFTEIKHGFGDFEDVIFKKRHS